MLKSGRGERLNLAFLGAWSLFRCHVRGIGFVEMKSVRECMALVFIHGEFILGSTMLSTVFFGTHDQINEEAFVEVIQWFSHVFLLGRTQIYRLRDMAGIDRDGEIGQAEHS